MDPQPYTYTTFLASLHAAGSQPEAYRNTAASADLIMEEQTMDHKPEWTPRQLMEQLRENTIGQDQYLQDLCTTVWLHHIRKKLYTDTGMAHLQPKLNMLVLGKSGSGKTSTIQALAKLLDLCVVIEDASLFTGAGWRGRDVTSIVKDVVTTAQDPVQADFAVVVLDEIDKVFVNQADNPSFPATNNFLKMIEGASIQHEENHTVYEMETSNLLFICLGAFDGLEEIIAKRISGGKRIGFLEDPETEMPDDLYSHVTKEDLLNYGINHQFLGRISMITATHELKAPDLERILLYSSNSPVRQFDALLHASMGVHASITEAAARYLAEKSAEASTGARALLSELAEAYKPGLFWITDRKDVRELRLDCVQGKPEIKYITGERDPVRSPQPPKPRFSPEDLKRIPLKLNQYNPTEAAAYAEKLVENAILDDGIAARYTYRQIKAAVYLLAAALCDTLYSGADYTMYSVQQSLYRIVKQKKDGSRFGNFMSSAYEYATRSTVFEWDISKTVPLAVSIFELHCSHLLDEIEYDANSEV